MKVHRLTFGMVALFGHPTAMFTQFIIGAEGAVAGNKLHRFSGFEENL